MTDLNKGKHSNMADQVEKNVNSGNENGSTDDFVTPCFVPTQDTGPKITGYQLQGLAD